MQPRPRPGMNTNVGPGGAGRQAPQSPIFGGTDQNSKKFLNATQMNNAGSASAGAPNRGGTPQNPQMQRGVPTVDRQPLDYQRQAGQAQPRTSTPGARGAPSPSSPRMDSRSSNSAPEPPGSSGSVPNNPWEMAATGGSQYGLLMNGGSARAGAGGTVSPTASAGPGSIGGKADLNDSMNSMDGRRGGVGAPGNRRELTPGGGSAAHRRELTPGGGPSGPGADRGPPGRNRELTPIGAGGRPRELTPKGNSYRSPGGMGGNTAVPLVGSLGRRPPSTERETQAGRVAGNVTLPQTNQGAPAFNMGSGGQNLSSFGGGMPRSQEEDRSLGAGSPQTQLPPSINTLGWQDFLASQRPAGERATAALTPPAATDFVASQRPGGERAAPATMGGPAAADLEVKHRELETENAELNKRLDEDGLQFLEALISLEGQVEELTRQNKALIEAREQMEGGLLSQGSDGELRAKIMKMERERQDMLQQMDEFEREKEEDLRQQRETGDGLRKRLGDLEMDTRRKALVQEREKENMIEMVSSEGRESQERITKLVREKEALNAELAKALARAEASGTADDNNQAGGGKLPSSGQNLNEANSQLRIVMSERETLRDEVTNKGGQILLLQSQLEIKDRKLRIADMENAMLKSELEVLRRNAAAAAK